MTTTMMTQQLFARSRLAAVAGLALASVAFQPAAHAQAAPSPADPEAVSDRVKKDAAGPLYWIRLNAQKADAASTRVAPRITEVRSEPRAARAAPPAAAPANPPVRSTTAVAASLGHLPAAAGATARDPAASAAGLTQPMATEAAPGVAAAGAAAGAAGAGLAAPAGVGAAHLTRAATEAQAAADSVDEPDDQPLALLKAEEPTFPVNVMRKVRKGTVQVRFEVQADGSVADVTVVQTSHRGLNDAAIEAVGAWRFQPVRSPRSAVVDLGFDLDG
jgi:TonB family protein